MQYLVHSAPHNPLAENLVTIKFFFMIAWLQLLKLQHLKHVHAL